jgi:predicted nucleotidyltransferase
VEVGDGGQADGGVARRGWGGGEVGRKVGAHCERPSAREGERRAEEGYRRRRGRPAIALTLPPQPDYYAASMDALLRETIGVTRATWSEAFVALYAFGSVVRGETDEWSDLDVCLVRHPSDEGRLAAREWFRSLKSAFGWRVDPTILPVTALCEDATWQIAFLLLCLRERSWLLLGDDIRTDILSPPDRWLTLDNCSAPLRFLRMLYGIPRDRPVPRSLPALDCAAGRALPNGNLAWTVASTALNILRVIANLGAGTFSDSRCGLPADLRSQGEHGFALICEQALSLRPCVPRFAALADVPVPVLRVAASVPPMAERLYDMMADREVHDPSWEQPKHTARGVGDSLDG